MWRYLIYEASHINFERCAAEGRWLQGVSIHRELPTRGGSPEATDPETCHSPFGSAASLATQGGQPISLGRTPLTTSGVDPLGRRETLAPKMAGKVMESVLSNQTTYHHAPILRCDTAPAH